MSRGKTGTRRNEPPFLRYSFSIAQENYKNVKESSSLKRLWIFTILLLPAQVFIFASDLQADTGEREGVWQVGVGFHTYVLEGKSSDESSGLTSIFGGYYFKERLVLGTRFSHAKYTATSYNLNRPPKTETKSVISITPIAKLRFRANSKLQPCVDIGIGITDQYGGEGNFQFAATFGLELHFKVKDTWGLFIESRGVGWNQVEETIEGSKGSVSSSEFTLGYLRYY